MGLLDMFSRPVVTGITSPWSTPGDSFEQIVTANFLGIDPGTILTFETAMRIPAFKRAYEINVALVARMPWVAYDGAQRLTQQPAWLSNTRSGVAPRNLRAGVVGDLFCYGWAVIGFELGADGLPADAFHVPRGSWDYDPQAEKIVVTNHAVPARYQDRLVAIQLGYGSNGMLVDAVETLQDARAIQRAYRDRIENPIPSTDLVLTAEYWNAWTTEERAAFRQRYVENRRAADGAVSMRPDFVDVQHGGAQLPVDLFESGRNANRLDIANHAGLPGDVLEGSKQSGGGDMHYSTEAGGQQRNELWELGPQRFADAIEARLSLDDVCAPGISIRVDASHYLTSPQPTTPITSED